MNISGTFNVHMDPLETTLPSGEGVQMARMRLDKTYQGELDASSAGEMLSAVTDVPGSAGYVALERVVGTLSGLSGSFVLQHSGTMSGGESHLLLEVVPSSPPSLPGAAAAAAAVAGLLTTETLLRVFPALLGVL